MKAEGSEVSDHLWLHREIEASLSYIRFCLNTHTHTHHSQMHIYILKKSEVKISPSSNPRCHYIIFWMGKARHLEKERTTFYWVFFLIYRNLYTHNIFYLDNFKYYCETLLHHRNSADEYYRQCWGIPCFFISIHQAAQNSLGQGTY